MRLDAESGTVRETAPAAPGKGGVTRRAAAADVPAMHVIEAASFSDPWSRASFASLVLEPLVYVSVAEAEGAVCGYAVLLVAADEAEILNIAVVASARRRGIGARLLDDAILEGRARGARTMYLDVRDSNVAARALYESRGFVEAGRRRKYYTSPVEDAVSLRLALTT